MAEQIINKRCSKCKITKSTSEFYKHSLSKDGYQYWCKKCASLYHKKYSRTEHGKQTLRQTNKKHYKTEKFKLARRRGSRQYRKHNPAKIGARCAVHKAIKRASFPKPTQFQCSCGKQAQEYHHPSYAKKNWLKVIPVCSVCHRRFHTDGRLVRSPIIDQ